MRIEMEKISKERRDAIRAAAEKATPGPWEVGPVDDTVVTHLGADGLRYEVAGIDGDYNSPDEWPTMEANAAHIANCDPQTILALLDALDAAEAETSGPIGFANPDTLDDPAFTVRGKEAGGYTVPLYERPAPAVREGWKPTHWALYSVSGSHIGLWQDETWVERLQAQYPGSTILPLAAAPEAK